MNVYCMFKRFVVQFLDDKKRSVEEIFLLEKVFLDSRDAQAYKKAHPLEERKKLHIEVWNAE